MNLIRDKLEAKLRSCDAIEAGLKYTNPQDTLRYWRKADNTKGFPVYVRWGGRTPAGVRSRLLRSVIQVVVGLGPMLTADPWQYADKGVDAALGIIYMVPGTFPELLPILPLEVTDNGKAYAYALIQVVGG